MSPCPCLAQTPWGWSPPGEQGRAGDQPIIGIETVNPFIFRNTIHRAKQKRKRDTSFVIRCIVRVRFFNYLTKFYSPFIKCHHQAAEIATHRPSGHCQGSASPWARCPVGTGGAPHPLEPLRAPCSGIHLLHAPASPALPVCGHGITESWNILGWKESRGIIDPAPVPAQPQQSHPVSESLQTLLQLWQP